jgi:hypothetical protein
LEQELGQTVRFQVGETASDSQRVVGEMIVDYAPACDTANQEELQLRWLVETANSLVTALRTRLK